MSSCGNGAPDRSGRAQQERAAAELLPCRRIRYTPRIAALSLLLLVWVRVRVRRHVETPAVHLSLENSARGYERQPARAHARTCAGAGCTCYHTQRNQVPCAQSEDGKDGTRDGDVSRGPSPTGSGSSICGGKACAVGVHGHDKGVGLGDGTEDVLLVERFIVGLAAGLIVGVAVSASARCALREDRRDTAGEVDVGLAHEHGLRSREGSGERRRRRVMGGWSGAARDAAV